VRCSLATQAVCNNAWRMAERLNCSSYFCLTPKPWFLWHFRDKDKVEVDFVLESPSREVIGIEVKAAASVISGDFKGLRKLRELVGKRFVTGIVLYDGTLTLSFGDGLWAVPLNRL
jgi:predicted AAA+ superfamily ATPase